jgi:hypothetical protein
VTDLRDQLADFEATAARLGHTPAHTIRITSGRRLGDLLRRMRLDAGLTLDQLGHRAHVSRSGVSKRELATRALSVGAFVETANALGYDVQLTRRRTA